MDRNLLKPLLAVAFRVIGKTCERLVENGGTKLLSFFNHILGAISLTFQE